MSWNLTYTGRKFYPTDVAAAPIHIVDIAHGLSNICRFAGHTPRFYSVAQHSVIVSAIVQGLGGDERAQLAGLLHDATEAYLIDLPQPLKILPELAGYRDIEKRLELRIREVLGVLPKQEEIVKKADLIALSTEARDLMGDPKDWPSIKEVKPHPMQIIPLDPADAKAFFMERYLELRSFT